MRCEQSDENQFALTRLGRLYLFLFIYLFMKKFTW